tara:strand:- start:147 stop:761 length:615 start_codon:yes stop_codon:yes gene_type:complete
MSFNVIAWAMKQSTKTTGSKLVLIVLANYADEKGHCYPSQQHIADICACSRQSVNKYIAELKNMGFIKITKKSNGMLVYNEYNLDLSNVSIKDNGITNVKDTVEQSKDFLQNTINTQIPNRFEEFWKNVPRKIAKSQSKKIYDRLIKKKEVDEEFLIDRIKAYAVAVKDKEMRYVLHPSTWLNQKRWEDELEEAKPKGVNWLAG